MKSRYKHSIRPWLLCVMAAAPLGCEQTLNVVGVYFPGWLVSVVSGVAISYTVGVALSRQPSARKLADSGLLFVSLAVNAALAVWWVCFSRF